METLLVCLLIVMGFMMVVLEFLVCSDCGIAGVIGFTCLVCGVSATYQFYDIQTAHWILMATVAAVLLFAGYLIFSGRWARYRRIHSSSPLMYDLRDHLKAGDVGMAFGRLCPMGKIKIEGMLVEAESISGYVDSHLEVEVVKVFKDKILVKIKTEDNGR